MLTEETCREYPAGSPPLTEEEVRVLGEQLSADWAVKEGKKIEQVFTHKNFLEAISFVNKVAAIAEEDQHHPDVMIQYNKVTISLSTHSVNGLSRNDFIVAAKIDGLE